MLQRLICIFLTYSYFQVYCINFIVLFDATNQKYGFWFLGVGSTGKSRNADEAIVWEVTFFTIYLNVNYKLYFKIETIRTHRDNAVYCEAKDMKQYIKQDN